MGYFNQIIGLRPWMAEPYFYRLWRRSTSMTTPVLKLMLRWLLSVTRSSLVPISCAVSLASRRRSIRLQSRTSVEDSSSPPRDAGLQYNLSIALLQDKRYAAADSAAQRLPGD